MRQEKERTEKSTKRKTKAQLNLTTKEMAVFFYCPTKNKLSPRLAGRNRIKIRDMLIETGD
jgi:hypothetical protein